MNAIETSGLGKRYRGIWALRDCALAVPTGRVIALIGPNGAGKTTLLHLLAGLTAPTAGAATVLGGEPAGSPTVRERVAFVGQDAPLYRHLRVRDAVSVARDLNDRWDQRLAQTRLDELRIPARRRVGKLSGGQQAQLALTLALARRPELLLLDEPLARLDPLARHDFLASLMSGVYEDAQTVVFSSHVIAELEQVANYLVVLARSRVQLAGPTEDLLSGHRMLTGPADGVSGLSAKLPVVSVKSAARQAHVLTRSSAPPPAGWDARSLTMNELVLAYLRAPDDSPPPAPATAGGRRLRAVTR